MEMLGKDLKEVRDENEKTGKYAVFTTIVGYLFMDTTTHFLLKSLGRGRLRLWGMSVWDNN